MRALRGPVAPPVVSRPVRRPRRDSLSPNDAVACDRYEAVIPLKTCLQRQAARWPSKPASIYPYCGSGKCAQGAEYRVRAAYSAAEDWAGKSKAGKSSYQFFRKDAGLQRKRRRLQALSQPVGEVPSIDRPWGARPAADPGDLTDSDVPELLSSAGGIRGDREQRSHEAA